MARVCLKDVSGDRVLKARRPNPGTFIPNYWDPKVCGKTPFPKVPIPRPEKKQVMTKEEAAEVAALEKEILDVGKADRVGWVSEHEAYPYSDWDKALP